MHTAVNGRVGGMNENMTELNDITTQQIICVGLIIVALASIILQAEEEVVMIVIGGLIGYLTNDKVDTDELHETIQDGITDTLEDIASEDTITVEQELENNGA